MKVFTPEETQKWFAGLEKRMSSSAVAITDANDQVLIIKTTYQKQWSFPGGIIDAGETPLKAAVRETQEEVGLALPADDHEFCFVLDHASTFIHTYQFVYEINVNVIGAVRLDENEIEEYAIVSRQQIISRDRLYTDPVTLWAEGLRGYAERALDEHDQIDD
jgi:8-oxo-dGTP pyrophosphatase MutT (NUDIX family)